MSQNDTYYNQSGMGASCTLTAGFDKVNKELLIILLIKSKILRLKGFTYRIEMHDRFKIVLLSYILALNKKTMINDEKRWKKWLHV